MIYGGDLMSNFAGSIMAKDYEMTKDVVLSKLHRLIKDDKVNLISALKDSGVSIKENPSDLELIDESVDALFDNKKFQRNFAYLIASESSNFSNGSGNFDFSQISSIFGGGSSGSSTSPSSSGSTKPNVTVGADPVSAIAGAIGSIFSFASAKTNKNTQKDLAKQQLIGQLLQDEKKKTNWLPIVIIGGVLTIGGIIAIITLRKK